MGLLRYYPPLLANHRRLPVTHHVVSAHFATHAALPLQTNILIVDDASHRTNLALKNGEYIDRSPHPTPRILGVPMLKAG